MSVRSEVDLTSSLFLGYRHDSPSLATWSRLTTGVPAALREDSLAGSVAQTVAEMQGAQAGVVSRSTLHALNDVLSGLPNRGDLVAVDEFAYPIAHWAAHRAVEKGAVMHRFSHHRPGQFPATAGRLFLVTDGWCPGCNRPAPLGQLQRLALRSGGMVVIDDTLAAGVLGRRSVAGGSVTRAVPDGGLGGGFGGGEGTVRWSGLDHRGIVWVASLAKAFGSPLTVITGDLAEIRRELTLLARVAGRAVG